MGGGRTLAAEVVRTERISAPRGLDLMVLGFVGGTGAWLIQRALDERARA